MVKKNLLCILAVLCVLSACGGRHGTGKIKTRPHAVKGGEYTVKKGDTLSRIAERADISTQYLAEYNNIDDPAKIAVGQKIYIPKRAERRNRSAQRHAHRGEEDEVKTEHGKFVWPLYGRLAGLFGPRRSTHHDGIDIFAKHGSKIVAAGDGQVVYNGRLHGYGKIIIIRHPDDYFTAYAHNSANLVKKGKKVKGGKTVIAKVGKTGNASGPHLHFEVRYRELPRNPLFYLPKTDAPR